MIRFGLKVDDEFLAMIENGKTVFLQDPDFYYPLNRSLVELKLHDSLVKQCKTKKQLKNIELLLDQIKNYSSLATVIALKN